MYAFNNFFQYILGNDLNILMILKFFGSLKKKNRETADVKGLPLLIHFLCFVFILSAPRKARHL